MAVTVTKKTKLTPAELESRNLRMYEAKANGDTSREIGRREGLHHGQVDRILRGMKGKDGSKQREHKKPLPLLVPHDPTMRIKNGQPMTNRQREKAMANRNGNPKVVKKAVAKSKSKVSRKSDGLSLIDAAVVVLQSYATGPMHPKRIVEVAIEQKLWKPGSGATPFATLWSGILAEIKRDEKEKTRNSRFKLVAPGMFGLTTKGREWKPTAAD